LAPTCSSVVEIRCGARLLWRPWTSTCDETLARSFRRPT
jgi:hypothetical protein